MPLATAVKAKIVETHKQSANDTGSPEVQIALLSARITMLTEHLKVHKRDFHTRLMKLVSQRRKLMRYLKNKSVERYQAILKQLDLRG